MEIQMLFFNVSQTSAEPAISATLSRVNLPDQV